MATLEEQKDLIDIIKNPKGYQFYNNNLKLLDMIAAARKFCNDNQLENIALEQALREAINTVDYLDKMAQQDKETI